MDISSVIGIVIGVGTLLAQMILAASVMTYYDVPSFVGVFGGLISATFIKWPIETVKMTFKIIMKVIFYAPSDAKATIEEVCKLAEVARRESVFALEKVPIDDPFLKKAMTLAADNRPPEVIKDILQMEIDSMANRHELGQKLLGELAADGPAFGMIGTLVGLVAMLQNLSDPSAIGPSMAVALLTTFYGAVVANQFFNPFKFKLSVRSGMEKTKMEIIIAGTLGIVAGENPRLIKEKLNAFLPPSQRIAASAEE